MLRFEDLKVGDIVICKDYLHGSRYELVLKITENFYDYYDFTFNEIRYYEKFDFEYFVAECGPEIILTSELFED